MENALFEKDLYVGMKLKALSNFCLREGNIYEVLQREDGEFYVECDAGMHVLFDESEEDGVIVGIIDFAAVF